MHPTLTTISEYQYNWDGYRADPFSYDILLKADTLLNLLTDYNVDIGPCSDGTIVFTIRLLNSNKVNVLTYYININKVIEVDYCDELTGYYTEVKPYNCINSLHKDFLGVCNKYGVNKDLYATKIR